MWVTKAHKCRYNCIVSCGCRDTHNSIWTIIVSCVYHQHISSLSLLSAPPLVVLALSLRSHSPFRLFGSFCLPVAVTHLHLLAYCHFLLSCPFATSFVRVFCFDFHIKGQHSDHIPFPYLSPTSRHDQSASVRLHCLRAAGGCTIIGWTAKYIPAYIPW